LRDWIAGEGYERGTACIKIVFYVALSLHAANDFLAYVTYISHFLAFGNACRRVAFPSM
jgi:hypothetical protein